jgi:peptidoglycan hydrolase-like protein with peptidoglycan-binding domain
MLHRYKHLAVSGLALAVLSISSVVQADTATDDLYKTLKVLTEQVETLAAQLRQRETPPLTNPSPETVRRVQSILSNDTSLYPEGFVTGYYGPLTTAALERLQVRYGLPATGNIDETTLAIVDTIGTGRATSTNLCANPILQKTRFCSSIPKDPTPSSTVPSSLDNTNFLDTGYENIAPGEPDTFPGVTSKLNQSYGDKKSEVFDFYRPADIFSQKALPTIVMVHGGGWKRGDKSMGAGLVNHVTYFTERGYNYISINYPLENIDPKEEVESVARATRYFQRNARRLGIDASDMVLMGHSAGAHLVTLLTSDKTLRRTFRLTPWQATIALDSAAYNVPAVMEAGHLPSIYEPAFGDDPEFWKAMSPYHQYRGSTEDFLLVCSSTRPDDACGEAEKFMEKVISVTGSKDSATLLPEALNHGQINSQVGTGGDYTESIQEFLTSHNLP